MTIAAIACLLAGCQTAGLHDIAARQGLRVETAGAGIPLQILHRPPIADERTLRLYFDGDGTPWRDGVPARHPNPAGRPLGLRLFLKDPQAHGYVGRPCYLLEAPLPAACSTDWWTSHRYSAEVVSALAEQVQRLAGYYDRSRVELIGYSGGGTLALLVAATLPEVERVITLAAPLDVHGWTAFHQLLPLSGSLSPLTVSRRVTAEERHFSGASDKVVPPSLATPYLQRYPEASLHVIDGFDHRCCWESYWPALLQTLD